MYSIKRKIKNAISEHVNSLVQVSVEEIDDQKTTTAQLQSLCRQAGAESCVLLENKETLPLKGNVAVFGRVQQNYFYVGYGSGGDVKAPYRISLIEGLKNSGIDINKQISETYEKWIIKNPPYDGYWGAWPMNYDEMPVSEQWVRVNKRKNETAIIVIGRSAGEDRENKLEKGSWFLTNLERKMLKAVCGVYDKVCVILNTGSIMDMSWVKEYAVSAVLYVWQGGQESGNSIADVLTGKVCPSGKLPDTIAGIRDYPSTRYFGAREYNNYVEDIYVGYRYFETFAPEKVLYPFGYGLSYTNFSVNCIEQQISEENIKIKVSVKNTGTISGKEVVQVYYGAPQGKLGKASKSFICYKKTKFLQPGEEVEIDLFFLPEEMASFDDAGVTGQQNSYVLEAGEYPIYIGTSVRDVKKVADFIQQEQRVVKVVREACPVQVPFKRLVNHKKKCYEITPVASRNLRTRILEELPTEIGRSEDKGYKLYDVKAGSISMDQFVGQLSDIELEALVRGSEEGMYAKSGVSGNAGILGGTIPSLREKGIPVINTNDGPSGLRLQAHCTLLPIGIALSSTFNDDMIKSLLSEVGKELKDRQSQVILAPGINIHRNPLCGRNFEYFSEDPRLTGNMAIAYVKGIQDNGGSAVIKHFACNNQETNRNGTDSRVSPRALREIYLKAFEICVKEAEPDFVMTSYNRVNGVLTCYNYDLVTEILRKEWNYKGCVMTDWWMRTETSPDFPNVKLQAYRVRAQVDLFMPGIAKDGEYKNKVDDTLLTSLHAEEGISLGEIQRSAMKVLRICNKYIN